MSAISEEAWRAALTEVLEQLDEPQYNKMLLLLSEIPKCVKTKSRVEMPQAIIERYGVEKSVRRIIEITRKIPRNDNAVQHRLRPFVDKLKIKREKTGKKRKRGEAVLKSADRKDEAGEQKSCEPDEVKQTSSALRGSLVFVHSDDQRRKTLKETEPAGAEKPQKRTESRNRPRTSTGAKKTSKASTVSEKEWKKALSAILRKLKNHQYDVMLRILEMPKQKKTAKFKEQLPQKIIERYGMETSIQKIEEALIEVPRQDEAVQRHLRPFVDKLENRKRNGKRKSCQPDQTDAAVTTKPKRKKAASRDPSLQSPAEAPRAASVSRLQHSDPSEPAEPKQEEPGNRDSPPTLNRATKTPKGQRSPVPTVRIKIKAVTATKKTNTHLVVMEKTQLKEVFVRTRLLAGALGRRMDEGVDAGIRDALPIAAAAKIRGKKIVEIKKIFPVGKTD